MTMNEPQYKGVKGKRKNLFLEAYKESKCQPASACKKTGVTLEEYEAWIAKDLKFASHVNNLGELLYEDVLSGLITKALEGSVSAQTLYLKLAGECKQKDDKPQQPGGIVINMLSEENKKKRDELLDRLIKKEKGNDL